MLHFLIAFLAAILLVVHAQTVSVTDASGNVIVEVITTLAIGAAPVTSILTTISASTTSTSTSVPLTQPTIQQGPVGQPASTSVTPGAPIPYIYTTVINGQQTVIQDTFTPTSPSTVSVAVTGTGSIMAFSDFTSLFGAVPTSSAQSTLLRSSSTWVILAASAVPLLVGILAL
ncbi:hypothetical protein BDN70DRAFT_361341 [Pholiota conissans]|uniref:Uncharacterized protein n=1 Tax=Pholiota conissans TaxID=109636 RepID=A0A9P5YTP8_9AGAR|nr:hypothetical protein BDN70DRAFT_361341 [Pholiota conissans]